MDTGLIDEERRGVDAGAGQPGPVPVQQNRVKRGDRRLDRRLACLLFAVTASVLLLTSGGHLSSVDETTMLRTTQALLHGQRQIHATGTPEEGLLVVTTHRGDEEIGIYGLGTSITGIPGYLVARVLSIGASPGRTELIERFGVVATNCLIAALGTALVFMLARRLGARRRPSVLIALAYSFGTYAFVLDRTWWCDVPASVATVGAVLAAVIAVQSVGVNPRLVRSAAAATGLLLAAGLWFRLTGLLYAPLVTAYVAFAPADRSRAAVTRRVVAVAAGAAPLVLGLAAANWWRFGSPLETGYPYLTYQTPIATGAYGLLLGPSRGLLWYGPPALAGVIAIVIGRREHLPERLLGFSLLLVTVLLFARYSDWYGGQSYGPRYLLSVVPVIVALAATGLDRRWWWRFVGGLAVVGFAVNSILGICVYFQSVYATSFEEAAIHNGEKITDPGAGPRASETIHHVLAYSPLVRAAIHLPDSIKNTIRLADGDDERLDPGPFPDEDVRARQFYLDDVHMVDVWWLRWRVSGGPDWMLVFVPVLGAAAVLSSRELWRTLR